MQHATGGGEGGKRAVSKVAEKRNCYRKYVFLGLELYTRRPRAPGVAAVNYVSTGSSLPLAHRFHKLLF